MTNEYLATGFRDVDGAGDCDAYAACLSLINSLPYYRDLKRNSYEWLELGSSEHVLDAGCGLGEDVFRMAQLVAPGGRVTGVDASAKLIERAKADPRGRDLPVEFCQGDLRELPFSEGTFTRCRIDRVLQHVPDAGAAVHELTRVLKANGLLLAYDNDWGTFSINLQDKRITRLLETSWCDSFPNGWIGRQLQGYFTEAGLINCKVHPGTSIITDFDTADKLYNLRQTVQRTIAAGKITEEEGAAWLDELGTKNQSGCFWVAVTAYTVIGQKPG